MDSQWEGTAALSKEGPTSRLRWIQRAKGRNVNRESGKNVEHFSVVSWVWEVAG